MDSIQVSDELAKVLREARREVGLVDSKGTLLGIFVPIELYRPSQSEVEAKRRLPHGIRPRIGSDGRKYYTTADVMKLFDDDDLIGPDAVRHGNNK